MLARPEAVQDVLAKFEEWVARLGVLELLKEAKRTAKQEDDETFYLWDEEYYKGVLLRES